MCICVHLLVQIINNNIFLSLGSNDCGEVKLGNFKEDYRLTECNAIYIVT